jgi:hypothetical protein
MSDETNVPVTVAPLEGRRPATGRRVVWLLALGGVVGLALGVSLTTGAFVAYTTVTQTVPAARESIQVFNELNELRQQVNQLNKDREFQDQKQLADIRQTLSSITLPPPRPPEAKSPAATLPAVMKVAEARPARRAGDPFADLDAEIEQLEQTQKVLNTILDLFTPKPQELPPAAPAPPK